MSQATTMNFTRRYQNFSSNKSNGETYTPKELSNFVARHMCDIHNFSSKRSIKILDPSIGYGELSMSLIYEVRKIYKGKIELFAFDTNLSALEKARDRIKKHYPDCILHFKNTNFLQFVIDVNNDKSYFDLIIANPPYVRTQVIGSDVAQKLAVTFDLGGKVDLYQAFLLAMTKLLDPNGTAGFIVSNRFMTTRGSKSLRKKLHEMLTLRKIWDLGDTKLFNTAVLPAVIIANGIQGKVNEPTSVAFTSIYETKASTDLKAKNPISALSLEGVVAIDDGRHFLVKSGILDKSETPESVWRIATNTSDIWITTVKQHTACTFGKIGNIRVGVKTCADKIFIRHDWETATNGKTPELLKPLTTHHSARRYRAKTPKKIRYILYPHTVVDGKRLTNDLDKFPKSKAYLESNRAALEKRTYVIESGRKWYEIWVPQDPASWSYPKLVFRDISEQPTFWLDLDGSIVNGDCYWMTATNRYETELLWLAVAVANSTFIEAFYDHCFNNKLYAGRRRFITQYVKQFPLPEPSSPLAQTIITKAKAVYDANHKPNAKSLEDEIDMLVWKAFGFCNK